MPKTPAPRKHGNRWQINFKDADGKRRYRTFRTKKEAQLALHHLNAESQLIRAGLKARPPEPRSFDELADYWLEHRTKRKRNPKDDRSMIRKHLRPFFGGMQLVEITVARVDEFRRSRGTLSDKTVHNILTLLISMLGLAEDLGWLAAKPKIKKPRMTDDDYRWLRTKDEIRKLLVAARGELPGTAELYTAAIYTGMRAGELLGLRWADVDLDRRLVSVKRSYDKPTKTGAIRHVPILDPLLPVLKLWKLQVGSEWVFPNRDGNMRQPSDRVLQEKFQKCLAAAELDRIRFHDLRHTFASHWVMGGGDLFKLQRILGHKTAAMTQRYAHLAPDAFAGDLGVMGQAVAAPSELRVLPGS